MMCTQRIREKYHMILTIIKQYKNINIKIEMVKIIVLINIYIILISIFIPSLITNIIITRDHIRTFFYIKQK